MAAFTEKEMNEFKMANWYDLSGQVAIVTGGSTGLGLAVTRCLVSAGAKVCVVALKRRSRRQRRWRNLALRQLFTSLILQIRIMQATGRPYCKGTWKSGYSGK